MPNLINNSFILGRYKASRIAKIHLDSEIYLVSNLTENIKRNLFVRTFNSPEEAFTNVYRSSTLTVFKD